MRPRPSSDNPVVIEGILPDNSEMPPGLGFQFPTEIMKRACCVGLEEHLVRHLEVSMKRQGITITAFESLDDISWVFPQPGILWFNQEKMSRGIVDAFLHDRNWRETAAAPIGLDREREAARAAIAQNIGESVRKQTLHFLALPALFVSAAVLIVACLIAAIMGALR